MDVIINLQKPDTWKIQLTIGINFISFQRYQRKTNAFKK